MRYYLRISTLLALFIVGGQVLSGCQGNHPGSSGGVMDSQRVPEMEALAPEQGDAVMTTQAGPENGITIEPIPHQDLSQENYELIRDNPFYLAKDNPLSTFGIDVDPAAYSNVRRFLNDGMLPPVAVSYTHLTLPTKA